MSRSFRPYFQDAYNNDDRELKPGYIRGHYDTTGFCSGKLTGGRNKEILGKLRNSFIEAIQRAKSYCQGRS